MQFESFHWLSPHELRVMISCSTNMVCIRAIFWDDFIFILFYLRGVFNKTLISLALVAYEMIIAISALRALMAIYHLISNARSWLNTTRLKYRINSILYFTFCSFSLYLKQAGSG